jgi:predicted Zn-dependent peptidase
MIEHMAFKGTARRGAREIAREIDRMGGMANAFTSKEHTCFHARTLPENLPLLCDLLLDIFLNPRMDPVELERERQVILQEISSVDETPDELAHVLFNGNYWPGHPLGAPILGTAQSVGCLNRESIIAYLKTAYTAGGLVVAAVGAIEHNQILDLMGSPWRPYPLWAPRMDAIPPSQIPSCTSKSIPPSRCMFSWGLRLPARWMTTAMPPP